MVHIQKNIIIAVNKRDIFAGTGIQTRIASGGGPGDALVDHPNTLVCGSIFLTDRTASIGASIIDQKQFPVGEGLPQDAVHTAGQILFRIIYRDDHRN